jgi:hypothetical protein
LSCESRIHDWLLVLGSIVRVKISAIKLAHITKNEIMRNVPVRTGSHEMNGSYIRLPMPFKEKTIQ